MPGVADCKNSLLESGLRKRAQPRRAKPGLGYTTADHRHMSKLLGKTAKSSQDQNYPANVQTHEVINAYYLMPVNVGLVC